MLIHYGVLTGKAIDRQLASATNEHYQILVDANGEKHRIAVNVQSQLAPPEVLFYMNENFTNPITDAILKANLAVGYTKLESKPNGIAIDFVRGNLFSVADMKPVPPHNLLASDDNLNQKLDLYVQQAIKDADAVIYAFGEKWGPEAKKPDQYFHFEPGNGIHDIHMNQGNSGSFKKDNGVYQDGALIIHLPASNKWVAMFIAFQVQSFKTDDKTGDPIGKTQPTTDQITIVAAMINPKGADTGKEYVTLLNKGKNPVNLQNWKIADNANHTDTITSQTLAPNATITVHLNGHGAQLGNNGGSITLLDQNNKKIDTVSYTKKQALQEAVLVKF